MSSYPNSTRSYSHSNIPTSKKTAENSGPRILTRGIAAVLAVLAAKGTADAQTSTWNVNNSGNWSATANWAGGIVADGADNTANFIFNINATRTVTLDSARTIGNLVFQDATTVSNDWILASNTLTLDVTSGMAGITVLNRTATISSVLAGNDPINVMSAPTGTTGGTLILSGANTFSGGLTLSGGILQLNNASAAGTGTITIAPSTNTGIANRLAINGGVSIANNIEITGGAPVAGFGVIQQVGTGQSVVNGTITISAGTTNGGHFAGGAAVGNELVLNGFINSSATVAQRAGRVIYTGGGSYNAISITGTAIVGSNNALSTTAAASIGVSGAGTLDIGSLNQTLTGVTFGSQGIGTITGTTGILTLNGDLTSSGNFTHVLNGNVDLGGQARSFTIANGTNEIDLTVGATLPNGTISKFGSGVMQWSGTSSLTAFNVNGGEVRLNGILTAGTVTVDAAALTGTGSVVGNVDVTGLGTLAPGTLSVSGTITASTLSLNTGSLTVLNAGTSDDLVTVTGANGLNVNAGSTMRIVSTGGPLAVGTTDLISYAGTIQGAGLAGFTLTGIGHAAASLVEASNVIRLNVTQATDTVIWKGPTGSPDGSGPWDTDPANEAWKFQTGAAPTGYLDGDDVRFEDLAIAGPVTVNLVSPVMPSRVVVDNTSATTFNFTGAGISGPTGLTKNGSGTLVLLNTNTYTGPTTINSGILELDTNLGTLIDSTTPALGTSVVDVAAGATFRITNDDGAFTFNRNISGAGTVEVNAHSVSGGTTAHSILLTGNNTGLTGTLRLLSPLSGSYRIQTPAPAALGSAAIEVQNGAQLYTAANQVYNNSVNITGGGFVDANGLIGALRLEPGSTWAGPVIVNSAAKIGSHNGTATVSGNISGGELTVNATNYNNSYTLIFTGTNTYGDTIIGGLNTQTAGVPSMRLNIGAGGTTGTLGTGNVIINGDGANGVLGFDRSDGYTLLPGQTITGATGSGTITGSITRTFIDIDTRGTGFSDNGNSITLGAAAPASGGAIRIAQARANAIANISGGLIAERIIVSSAQTGGVLNILPDAIVSANYLTAGEVANGSGTINQAAGSEVNVVGQVRLGHFGTNTSIYNMNGGTLTLTGATPNANPSTDVAGNTTTVGDNNLNLTNPTTIVGGGIYLGIDGTGIFNHNGGTVTTNWIVLDNRGNTGTGANMADGVDRYNLNGGILNLRSSYGLIQRNATAAVALAGGTIRVDNTGTGVNTGANLNIPLDADITVADVNSVLDTNGAGNAFTLARSVAGTSTLTLTGGGTVNLSPTGFQQFSANLASSGAATSLVKLGAGTTTMTGSASTFTGPITVSTGRLNLPGTMGTSSVTVADGAALGGEPTVASLKFGATTGSTLFIDASTPGALTATSLEVGGTATVDFAVALTAAGPITVVNYAALVGTPATPVLANASSYRTHSFDLATPGTIKLNLTTKDLTWTGATDGNWDVNTTLNWNDGIGADRFFAGDRVSFGDGPTAVTIAVSSGVSPFKTTVNSNTNNYTFNSTGNGLAGSGSLEKLGTSTLTLTGANNYAGKTVVGGGTLAFAAATSLGNGAHTNTIALSNGGRLLYTANAALDLSANRAIAVEATGGVIAHSGTTSAAIAIPGNVSGSGPLRFSTTGTSGTVSTTTNYVLSGDNSAFTGDIIVEAAGNILSTLTFASQLAIPNAPSITLQYPAGSVTTGNTTSLTLSNAALPAATTLNVTSFLNGSTSLRSQITSTGNSTINGPIRFTGNAGSVVQFAPPSGTLTINGNLSESSPGSFGAAGSLGVVFFRSAGNTVINGTINLPTALISRVDNTGITTINSTGNIWAATDVRSSSTLQLGVDNALPAGASMTIGQASDAGDSIFEMNGFDQEVNGLISIAGNGANNRRVTNSSTTLSTLTLNGTTNRTFGNSTGNTGGNITGNIALIKNGTYTQTLAGPANTYTGNVTINDGILVAGGGQNSTALGSPTTAGRVITVNSPGALNFTTNNVFGNGVNNNNLPVVILNGSTLSSTRYNVLGTVSLDGATLTQATTDTGAYEGFQFRGAVSVTGSLVSTIATTNGKANHLGANTVFDVGNVTATDDTDLLVSAPLRDQSGDFGQAAGGLTKTGPGTLEIASVSTYTGATIVNAGTLEVSGSISGSAVTINSGAMLSGGGTVGSLTVVGGLISPGTSPGTLTTGATSFDSTTTLIFELAQPGVVGGGINDLLSITGNFTLDGTLDVIDLPGFNVGSYRIANYSGGTFTNNGLILDPSFLAAYPGSFINLATPGEVNLVVVPEPASATIFLSGLGIVLASRRSRKNHSA